MITLAEFILVTALLLAIAALGVAAIAFLSCVKTKARMDALERAPVLRQYVERFVPIDNTENARHILEKKMEGYADSFERSLGLMDTEPTRSKDRRKIRNEANILRAEDLV